MKSYKITIFTPCYNASKTIARVFKSVENQTYGNFEWIIINDGSSDDSDEVIQKFISNSTVKHKIIYISQENKGKHRSWNRAVEIAVGDLFVCADADDSFANDTLEFFNIKANQINLVGSSQFSGINTPVLDPIAGGPVGNLFPADDFVCDNFEMAYKHKVSGEKWMCNQTQLLKKYKFPEVTSPFYPESRLWYSFALDGYKLLCCNKLLRSYYFEPNSLCNSFTVKFNKGAALAKLDYHFWLIKNAFARILSMDPMSAAKLLTVELWKDILMLIGGIIISASNILYCSKK